MSTQGASKRTTGNEIYAKDAEIVVENDPGLVCLIIIAHFHGVPADPKQLQHQAGFSQRTGRFSETDLLLAAKSLGLRARTVTVSPDRFSKTPLPALMLDGERRHFPCTRF